MKLVTIQETRSRAYFTGWRPNKPGGPTLEGTVKEGPWVQGARGLGCRGSPGWHPSATELRGLRAKGCRDGGRGHCKATAKGPWEFHVHKGDFYVDSSDPRKDDWQPSQHAGLCSLGQRRKSISLARIWVHKWSLNSPYVRHHTWRFMSVSISFYKSMRQVFYVT